MSAAAESTLLVAQCHRDLARDVLTRADLLRNRGECVREPLVGADALQENEYQDVQRYERLGVVGSPQPSGVSSPIGQTITTSYPARLLSTPASEKVEMCVSMKIDIYEIGDD